MNSYLQLYSFLVSFFYGIIFFALTRFNFYIIEQLNKYLKLIITFIFTMDMVIIYSIIIYKINNGYLHIYFIAMVLIGFFVGYLVKIDKILIKNLKKIVNKCKLFK